MAEQPARPANPADPSFDRYARMVRRSLAVPVALVSIVETTRQVFPGAVGLPEPYQLARETPLSHSFCQYVVADDEPLVVSDTRTDSRLHDNLAIEDLDVIAYAGWPIRDHAGRTIGSLCAIDHAPRAWTADELDALEDLAAACSTEIAQRELRRLSDANEQRVRRLFERGRVLLALSEGLAVTGSLTEIAGAVEDVAIKHLDCLRAGIWLRATEPSGGRGYLEYIPTARNDWPKATALAATVPTDDTNPLGEAHHTNTPVFLTTRTEQAERYPAIGASAAVGDARAFVPLRMSAGSLGALALTWDTPRHFTDEDRSTINALATYAAQAAQRAILLEEQARASIVLQEAMLSDLPDYPGVTLTAHYRPAAAREQVGGDWYDALVLPDGELGLVIGDVVGHDIQAAADMGQLRNMLRISAWTDNRSPAHAVEQLDRALHGLNLHPIASLIYARLTPPIMAEGRPDVSNAGWALTWTSAGHPPPVVLDPDGQARVLRPDNRDTLLGVAPELDRADNTAHLARGSTLLLYTDGLIERRNEAIDTGVERLATTAARHHARHGDDLIQHVLADLVGDHLTDDIAVLAVHLP